MYFTRRIFPVYIALLLGVLGFMLAACGAATATTGPTSAATAGSVISAPSGTTVSLPSATPAATAPVTTANPPQSGAPTTALAANGGTSPTIPAQSVTTTAVPPATTAGISSTKAVVAPATVVPGSVTVSGRVFDKASGKGLPLSIVTVGYKTIQLAAMTDDSGHYSVKNVPPSKDLEVISFTAGYTYLFSTQNIEAGKDLTVDFPVIKQPDPQLIPTVANPTISLSSAAHGQQVTFSMQVDAHGDAPLSPEVMVMNPVLGKSILLAAKGDIWSATVTVPDTVPAGSYTWTFFATDEACREPSSFPTQTLTITS